MTDWALTLILLAAAGGTAGLRAWRQRTQRRRARARVRALPELASTTSDGTLVRVTGTVRALETISSPLGLKTCVVHRSTVEVSVGSVREDVGLTPFLIDRGAEGTVLIDGTHAILDFATAHVQVIDRVRIIEFLARLDASLTHLVDARLEEVVIEPGQRIAVAGLVMMEVPSEPTSEERGFRENARPRLRLTGNAEHPLAIGKPED